MHSLTWKRKNFSYFTFKNLKKTTKVNTDVLIVRRLGDQIYKSTMEAQTSWLRSSGWQQSSSHLTEPLVTELKLSMGTFSTKLENKESMKVLKTSNLASSVTCGLSSGSSSVSSLFCVSLFLFLEFSLNISRARTSSLNLYISLDNCDHTM